MTFTQNNNHKTLIIFDWDDTLFPTSWMVKNNIDLTNKNTQNKYIILFSNLDVILHKLLTKLMKQSQIVIITNAVKKWIDISCVMLPKTQTIINNHIPVLSARDLYKQHYPNDMTEWKKNTFKKLATESENIFKNIISIGDAEYEFLATINLYDAKAHAKHKLLKTVRLFPDPTFDSLINQLDLLFNSFDKIILCDRHLDLKFSNNNKIK
jgi:hypothetical protein